MFYTGKTTGCSSDTKVSTLWQHNIFNPETHFVILFVVWHSIVKHNLKLRKRFKRLLFKKWEKRESNIPKAYFDSTLFWLELETVCFWNLLNNRLVAALNHPYYGTWWVIKFKKSQLIHSNLQLMSIRLGSIICHCHDKGVVVFVVIIKRIKEKTQTIPVVIRTKYRPLNTFAFSIPQSLKNRIF